MSQSKRPLQTQKNTKNAAIFASVVAGLLLLLDATFVMAGVIWVPIFLVVKIILDIGIAVEKGVRNARQQRRLKKIPFIDPTLCQTEPHGRCLLVLTGFAPVVIEAMDPGNIHHPLGLVEIVSVLGMFCRAGDPGTRSVASRKRRGLLR